MHWIWPSKLLGLGSICSFLLKNHGFLQGLGFSFLQKPAFLQVFRVRCAVKPRILQVFRVRCAVKPRILRVFRVRCAVKPRILRVFRVRCAIKPRILQVFRGSAFYFCSYFFFWPFFPDFQVPSGKGDSSIRLSYEIGRFPQNLPDPFFEVLFLLKPRRNGFLFYFQG